MPTINIYLSSDNYTHIQQEQNKSGLVNRLLASHYLARENIALTSDTPLRPATAVYDIPDEDEDENPYKNKFAILSNGNTTKKFELTDIEAELDETFCIHKLALNVPCADCGR